MVSDKMQEALNKQINAEVYSAYLYWSMSAYFEAINLPGHASWMYAQAQEEFFHAKKLFGFVHERGGAVVLTAIDGPPTKWESPVEVFDEVRKHEAHVTSLINGLVTLARAEQDYASEAFLQWFVKEQVEEESTADQIYQKLSLVKGEGAGLFMIDQELAARPFALLVPELAVGA